MELPDYLALPLLIITVVSFVVSLAALQVSLFKDDAREKRLKRLENEVTSLRSQIEVLQAEGLEKDKKIANQANQIVAMQGQIDEKELQIAELRRQIRPGTL